MTRSLISIAGADRVPFLQGILTQDVTRLAADKIQFAALLSPQGKILHDMFLIDAGDAILLDTATAFAPLLMKRLAMYKLRAKVEIGMKDWGSGVGELPDPRHPDLPKRDYTNPQSPTPDPLFPELGRDFAPDSLTALDAGYDLLHAVSFTKGCYVGQEITARMHYKAIARRGWFILERDGVAPQLKNLRFDDVFKDSLPISTPRSLYDVSVDKLAYRATLVPWMQPKGAQYVESLEKQP